MCVLCVCSSRRREERERDGSSHSKAQLELVTADVVSNEFKKDVLTPKSGCQVPHGLSLSPSSSANAAKPKKIRFFSTATTDSKPGCTPN